jgi:hypothetical protein
MLTAKVWDQSQGAKGEPCNGRVTQLHRSGYCFDCLQTSTNKATTAQYCVPVRDFLRVSPLLPSCQRQLLSLQSLSPVPGTGLQPSSVAGSTCCDRRTRPSARHVRLAAESMCIATLESPNCRRRLLA